MHTSSNSQSANIILSLCVHIVSTILLWSVFQNFLIAVVLGFLVALIFSFLFNAIRSGYQAQQNSIPDEVHKMRNALARRSKESDWFHERGAYIGVRNNSRVYKEKARFASFCIISQASNAVVELGDAARSGSIARPTLAEFRDLRLCSLYTAAIASYHLRRLGMGKYPKPFVEELEEAVANDIGILPYIDKELFLEDYKNEMKVAQQNSDVSELAKVWALLLMALHEDLRPGDQDAVTILGYLEGMNRNLEIFIQDILKPTGTVEDLTKKIQNASAHVADSKGVAV